MPRSRVFVSSVIEGFAQYRQAARNGIEQAGGEGVLVNEDFPSPASSSRNTCLDAIDSCDVFLLVLGSEAVPLFGSDQSAIRHRAGARGGGVRSA